MRARICPDSLAQLSHIQTPSVAHLLTWEHSATTSCRWRRKAVWRTRCDGAPALRRYCAPGTCATAASHHSIRLACSPQYICKPNNSGNTSLRGSKAARCSTSLEHARPESFRTSHY